MLFADFETKSVIDLKATGVSPYVAHPSTDVWMMVYAFDDEPVDVWEPESPLPPRVREYVEQGGLICFHNANFDVQVWNEIQVKRRGWPALRIAQVRDSMCMAYAMALPGSLENAAAAAGLTTGKDMSGHRVMLQLARPRSVENGKVTWWDDPDKLARLREYAKQDVITQRELYKRLLPLSPSEQKIWELDQTINLRGIAVDVQAVEAAIRIVGDEKLRLDKEMRRLTNNSVATCQAHSQLKDWLLYQNIDTAGVAKADIKRLVDEDDADISRLPDHVRRVLNVRREAAKTSTAKLSAMVSGTSADGRIRNTTQYHAATTGRWGGRRIQPQNLPRPKLKQAQIEEVFAILESRMRPEQMAQQIDLLYGPPMEVLSDCLRGFLTAGPGNDLMACDFANIEGRVLAWLAGEEWKLDAFRAFDAGTGPDLYLVAAGRIYNCTPTEATPHRQIGKVAELACIAEGQLVLTDRGLVPIERVTAAMRVWDGDSFVPHKGLVYRGIKEVLTYDGLTATQDHVVWTDQGPLQFGDAARRGARIVQSGSGWRPIRVGRDNQPGAALHDRLVVDVCADAMRRLRRGALACLRQFDVGQIARVPVLLAASAGSQVADKACDGYAVPLRKRERCGVQTVRRSRDNFWLRLCTGWGYLDPAKPGAAARFGTGPDRQQRPVRTGQSALRQQVGTNAQSAAVQVAGNGRRVGQGPESVGIPHVLQVFASWLSQRGGDWTGLQSGARQAKELARHSAASQRARVYDLVDCGPNHRFTVSGRLVHNCGYQGGVGAFQSMARIYGVKIPDAQADDIKTKWRKAHREIERFWYDTERAAVHAVQHPGKITGAGAAGREIRFRVNGSFLWMKLPSGRNLAYPYPRLAEISTPWGEPKQAVTFKTYLDSQARKKAKLIDDPTNSGNWYRVATYGGSLVENATQAVARDVLADAMVRLEAAGYPICLTIHDEIVCERKAGEGSVEEMSRLMCELSPWMAGLPIASEGWRNFRYKK